MFLAIGIVEDRRRDLAANIADMVLWVVVVVVMVFVVEDCF